MDLSSNSLTGVYGFPAKYQRSDTRLLCVHPYLIQVIISACAGSLPVAWVGTSIFSKDIKVLDLSLNRLSGSIPTSVGGQFSQSVSYPGQATPMVLSPMTLGYGLCGDIPANANITTRSGRPLLGQMGLGACPGQYDLADKCSTCIFAMRAFVRYMILDTRHKIDIVFACRLCFYILCATPLER